MEKSSRARSKNVEVGSLSKPFWAAVWYTRNDQGGCIDSCPFAKKKYRPQDRPIQCLACGVRPQCRQYRFTARDPHRLGTHPVA